MLRTRLIGTLVTASAVGLCLLALSCASNQQSANVAPKQDPVARGRYLVTIMSCNDCHTPGYFYGAADTLRRLSGSDIGWIGPWGVVHARNLTPDSATGIGSWTIEQIVKALRSGNTPDGSQLATIMPWQNYSSILDQDDAVADVKIVEVTGREHLRGSGRCGGTRTGASKHARGPRCHHCARGSGALRSGHERLA